MSDAAGASGPTGAGAGEGRPAAPAPPPGEWRGRAGGATRPPPSPPPSPAHDGASRNDLFFRATAALVPPRAKPPIRAETPHGDSPRLAVDTTAPPRGARGHAKKPSFGHLSVEERTVEEQRIRANHSVQFRVFLEREYKLGEGRSAEVYLGAYRGGDADATEWQLCAAKRIYADRASQLAGLDEAFALRRLGPHAHIVRLVAVVDEMGVPRECLGDAAPPADDPPRLLILLEYLPCTLATFTQREPQHVDLAQWLTWALQLAETVQWLHARGCVHGDIKMHNVLLTRDLDVKLCDFSSVLFSNAAVPATDCYSVGTPAFRAPELFSTARWAPPPGSPRDAHPALSYTLDVFSLGVLLYSLATGVQPSQRVSSVMAMRQRQSFFFHSEEDDRMERLSVGGGPGSVSPLPEEIRAYGSASPSSARASPSPGRAMPADRAPRVDLYPDVFRPSQHRFPAAAVERLLDPSLAVRGVVMGDARASRRAHLSPQAPSHMAVGRARSLHVARRDSHGLSRYHSLRIDQEARQNRGAHVDAREHRFEDAHPAAKALERAVSGDGRRPEGVADASADPDMRVSRDVDAPALAEAADVHRTSTPVRGAGHGISTPPSVGTSPALGRLSLSDSLGIVAPCTPPRNIASPDTRPYLDGAPALILPGGDRLPDTLRDLIKDMVAPQAEARPTAAQVVQVLKSVAGEQENGVEEGGQLEMQAVGDG
ncbi:hypothetical protein MSPP1_003185 [Malassezia sp. CBS 17886]|nr:hypothetical protein MSPP1_003185 [Malassezia sp. CBS 17886]